MLSALAGNFVDEVVRGAGAIAKTQGHTSVTEDDLQLFLGKNQLQ
jgi:hypothetical protein